MINNPAHKSGCAILSAVIFIFVLLLHAESAGAQGAWYWNQSLNTEASLLSGAVVAGESGIAAIFYNPATIPEMTQSNLSLSANLFSVSDYNAKNALGSDFPASRTQLDVQPRILTLTINPKNKPDLTIEIAYFCKTNDYMQINQGNSLTADIIPLNPGSEHYTADFYFRSKFQDYYGGLGLGYKVSGSFTVGFSAIEISTESA
jgi:long-subunit fatty acid transport protein